MISTSSIEITVGKYRNDKSWSRKKVSWSVFIKNLSEEGLWFTRTREKYKDYLKLPKDRQDEIKDVGGFVGALLNGGRRKKNAVICRTLITLDVDHMSAEEGRKFWPTFQMTFDCAAVLYSTHKHHPDNPRYRLLIPVDRNMSTEEYQAVARRVADMLGIDQFDHTGFQAERLMYYPSCSADGQYVFRVQEGPTFGVDACLDTYGLGPFDDINATAGLTGWQDSSLWPIHPRERKQVDKAAALQGNPLEKPGIVGAWCRAFNVIEALEGPLAGVYSAVDTTEDRYTYIHGSTSGGAIIYRDDQGNPSFIYSHHGTDPISEKLVNSFDLVRLHKFGIHDEGHEDVTDGTKLPSYELMREYATRNKTVQAQIRVDRVQATRDAFSSVEGVQIDPDDLDIRDAAIAEAAAGVVSADQAKATPDALEVSGTIVGAGGDLSDAQPGEDDAYKPVSGKKVRNRDGEKEIEEAAKWTRELDVDRKGTIRSTVDNVLLILTNDPHFKDRLWYDTFRHRLVIRGRLPWRKVREYDEQWNDFDDAALRHYMERVYQITGKERIYDALSTLTQRKKFHPVKDMLRATEWDGVKRVDRLLVEYLGAEDNEYTRTVTRKTLVGAVARAMKPGIKFDNVLVLVGEEGKMKSLLFDILAYPWFSDSMVTIQGKEAFEQLRGFWIIEMGELSALGRSENEQVKHFVAKRVDSYRAPWGRTLMDYPRSNIFVATTNNGKFLKGIGGDRRFWPVPIDVVEPVRNVADLQRDRNTVRQIWAEALEYFREGEQLFLSQQMFMKAREVQEEHTAIDSRVGTVEEYLNVKIPADWYDLSLNERRMVIRGEYEPDSKTKMVERVRVCVREVWTECFGRNIADLQRRDSDAISHMLDHIRGWKKCKNSVRIPKLVSKHAAWDRVGAEKLEFE